MTKHIHIHLGKRAKDAGPLGDFEPRKKELQQAIRKAVDAAAILSNMTGDREALEVYKLLDRTALRASSIKES